MKNYLITTAVALFFTSCYRDNEEELYPVTGNCVTRGATFNATVAPLLQNNGCMGCHSGSAPSGNISLQAFANVRAVALNGKLFGAINHSPGYSAMPKSGNKMNSCDIQNIKAWIDGGSLNN